LRVRSVPCRWARPVHTAALDGNERYYSPPCMRALFCRRQRTGSQIRQQPNEFVEPDASRIKEVADFAGEPLLGRLIFHDFLPHGGLRRRLDLLVTLRYPQRTGQASIGSIVVTG